MNYDSIFGLYGEGWKQIAAHDSSRENDFRFTYIVEYTDKKKLAVKAAKNAFTTPERIIGWAALIRHYNNLGIYCPKSS